MKLNVKSRLGAKEHMADIRKNVNNKQLTHAAQDDKPTSPKPVAVHFNSEGPCLKDFKLQILEMLHGLLEIRKMKSQIPER